MTQRFLDISRAFAPAKEAQAAWLHLCVGKGEEARELANALLQELHCTEPDASRFMAVALQPRFREALFEGELLRTEMQWGSLAAFRELFSRTPCFTQREILLSLLAAAESDRAYEEELFSLVMELLKRIRIADGILKFHRTVLLKIHESGARARTLRFHVRNFLQML